MNRKRRKHQYLIDGGEIPRTTAYNRMRKARRGVDTSSEELPQLLEKPQDDLGPLTSLTEGQSVDGNAKDINATSEPPYSRVHVENSTCLNEIHNELTHHCYNDLFRIEDSELQEEEDSDENNAALNWTDHENFNVEDEMEAERVDAEIIPDIDPDVFSENSAGGCDTQDPLLSNVLCPCSSSTAGDVLLYCLALGIRHNLTWAAMVDILKMVNLLYGYEAVSASKYYLQKLFYKQKSAKYHLYCSVCETYLGVKGEEGVDTSCECSKDANSIEPSTSFFVSVNIADQFRSLLQREDLANEILTYRFQRKKLNEEAFEDIFDGEAYKNLSNNGNILGDPYNISYIFNTDGVQMGKSTKNSAWPIFISVAELSPKNRKKNMIFAGVWVGKTQPNMRIFLKPFVNEANTLSEEGFFWTDSQNILRHSRAFPLCCIVDSAARFKLLNLISYTGYYGCTFCYQKAENTCKGRRFTILKKQAPMRTHHSMMQDMNDSFKQRSNPDKKKRIVKGCKGYTPLAFLKYFYLDNSVVVDSMHNSYLGASKTHTGHLLTTCKTEYYLGSPQKIFNLDARLFSLRTPSSITRAPRSIKEWKLWKASEWRSWLLCYALVILQGLVPAKYIHHLALFSTALYLLLQNSVSLADVEIANIYLRKYVYLIEKYFGKTAMVYNYHLLLHVCKGVRNFGPLWTHNAFDFEGENHHFMQLRTSSGNVAKQLVMRYSIYSQFPNLSEIYASSEKPLEFLSDITGKSLKSCSRKDGCLLVGSGRLMPNHSVDSCVKAMLPQIESAIFFEYEKMFLKGVRYCTKSYAEGKQHDDSYISLGPNVKARIDKIVQIKPDSESALIVLVVTPFTVMLPDFLRTDLVNVIHVKEIVKTGELDAITPEMISGQCVYVEFDNKEFLTDIPFGCYGD